MRSLLYLFLAFGLQIAFVWDYAHCGINDARFQRLFRVDLGNVSSHTTKGACCDPSKDTCDATLNLQCVDSRCACRVGAFVDETSGKCEKKDGKQLTESCDATVDNCYTAFSICVDGVCKCMEGFKPDGKECLPLVYRCPYGDPIMSGNRPTPCDISETTTTSNSTAAAASSDSEQCPTGFECIYAADPFRPTFTTLSGEEKGYCCPLIPDLDRTIVFQEQCLYGDWVPALECPASTHVYAFAISSAPLCCPKPCRPNYSSTIISGQCVEGLLP